MIEIRLLAAEHRPALEALLSEINEYYYASPRSSAASAAIASDLLEGGYSDTALAWHGDDAIGLAIYTFLQPTESVGSTLFLKELFVSERARNLRIGRQLMAYLTATAQARGCSRLDWTAQRGNAGTMRFYESLGAEELPQKAYFRVRDDEMDAFLARCQAHD